MRNVLTHRLARSRGAGWIAAVIVVASGVALSASVAQGRADPVSTQPATAALRPYTVASVTGGGTVIVGETPMTVVASFGVNARRPDGFTGGGPASGRVNYTEHANVNTRHLNAPVVLMEAAMSANPSPNGTGGSAAMSADCTAPADCSLGVAPAMVAV